MKRIKIRCRRQSQRDHPGQRLQARHNITLANPVDKTGHDSESHVVDHLGCQPEASPLRLLLLLQNSLQHLAGFRIAQVVRQFFAQPSFRRLPKLQDSPAGDHLHRISSLVEKADLDGILAGQKPVHDAQKKFRSPGRPFAHLLPHELKQDVKQPVHKTGRVPARSVRGPFSLHHPAKERICILGPGHLRPHLPRIQPAMVVRATHPALFPRLPAHRIQTVFLRQGPDRFGSQRIQACLYHLLGQG